MKKILVWEALPFMGGGQVVSLRVGRALRQSGDYEVVYLLPERGDFSSILKSNGFECRYLSLGKYSLGKKTLKDSIKFITNSFWFLIKFHKAIKWNDFDLLYVGGTRALIWSVLIAKLYGIPVVWHIHNLFEDSRVRRIISLIGRSRRVREVICVSDFVREQFPLLKRKSSVLYNAVDFDAFYVRGHGGSKTSDAPVVLSIGNLQPVKRLEDLLFAAVSLVKRFPNIKILIAGSERADSLNYAIRLKEMIARNKLDKNVFLLGPRDDVPDLLRNADVCVGMGREACPLFVLESFASGTPVIGADVGGTKELIEMSGGGLLYEFGNTQQLSSSIISVIENPSLRKQLGLLASSYAAKLTMEVFCEEVVRRFSVTLGGR